MFDQILKAFVIKIYVVYLQDSQKQAYQIKMLNYNFLYKLSAQSREAHHQNSSHLNHAYLNIFMYRLTKNLLCIILLFLKPEFLTVWPSLVYAGDQSPNNRFLTVSSPATCPTQIRTAHVCFMATKQTEGKCQVLSLRYSLGLA